MLLADDVGQLGGDGLEAERGGQAVDEAVVALRVLGERAGREARRRIDAQMGNDERAALADQVVWNNQDRQSLRGRIDEMLSERGLA